ncbi:chemotaxis protein CheW [Kineosporia succinea]|uniref:Purine-binding chemotaxis protein CheW n=1 Tax=Kineosporia succinea TaxID=84632 RepID=A0ABT9P6V7_9ACTN|nr:chemotaxis protein CheW [Kineosporia succinea]MDP9827795.1 purine-binding chemotaxis protein CheW [Kineosporia succinea]
MKTGVEHNGSGVSLLVCGTGGKTFAVPLTSVRETMRPLPTSAVPGMPPFVLGVARIRGSAVPVVDSGILTGGAAVDASRWITLHTDDHRAVALAVQSIAGIRTVERDDLEELPPLLDGDAPQLFSALVSRDAQLLLALQASHLLPDGVWERLAEVTSS